MHQQAIFMPGPSRSTGHGEGSQAAGARACVGHSNRFRGLVQGQRLLEGPGEVQLAEWLYL